MVALGEEATALFERFNSFADGSGTNEEAQAIMDRLSEIREISMKDPVHKAVFRARTQRIDFTAPALATDAELKAIDANNNRIETTTVDAAPEEQIRASGAPFEQTEKIYLPAVTMDRLLSDVDSGNISAASVDFDQPADGPTAEANRRRRRNLTVRSYISVTQAPNVVDFGELKRGDVMLKNGKGTNYPIQAEGYALFYSHIGMFDGDSQVYESNLHNSRYGVRLLSIDGWRENIPVAFMRNKHKTFRQVEGALDWAQNKYGTDGRTVYNILFTDKHRDTALYCSQLVWKIHKQMGVEVDSNSQIYIDYLSPWWPFQEKGPVKEFVKAVVVPDEIYLDNSLLKFDEGIGEAP